MRDSQTRQAFDGRARIRGQHPLLQDSAAELVQRRLRSVQVAGVQARRAEAHRPSLQHQHFTTCAGQFTRHSGATCAGTDHNNIHLHFFPQNLNQWAGMSATEAKRPST
jgi:hypothetical protein